MIKMFNAASQMWCLGRLLPLMIGDLIDEEEESMHWENFTTLLTILDFVLSPYTTVADANLVASLTQDFLAEFKELYPDRPLTPKMHYMIHLPSWMKM